MVSRYQKRSSGLLLDRIDIHIEVPWVEYEKLPDSRLGEPSAAMQQLHMSALVIHRLLKLARTIADLAGSDEILKVRLTEAPESDSRH